jgi:hypothetical protein
MNGDFVINGTWFPTQVIISLQSRTSVNGKNVANPWAKDFTIDIGSELDVFKINAAAEGVFLRDEQLNPVGNIVAGDLRLAAGGQMGADITWESSDPCIEISGTPDSGYYQAAVTRDENENKTVTLTATLALGSQNLAKAFTVTVPAKEPLMAVASDAHVPLDADGRTPQAVKNYWLVTITNSNPNLTVKDNISAIYGAVVKVPETWPDGFAYSVQKEDDRVIRITLEESASSPITQTAEVQFIITPLAVNNGDGFKDSDPVTFYIDPPGAGGSEITVDTANSDLILQMQEGNTQPDSANNSWMLKISDPQIKSDVSLADLEITGLPEGLNVQNVALDQPENAIIITVAGTASQAVEIPVNVGITVKASAASENGYEDSVMVTAVIQPYGAAMTDADKVAADKAALTDDMIKGGNSGLDNVTADLNLITSIPGGAGCSISWASSNEGIVATNGTVTRPAYGSGDAAVTLTATITSGSASDTKAFTVTVKAQEGSSSPEGAVTDDNADNTNIDAAVDNFGNIHLIYLKSGNLYYKKYSAGSGWGQEELVAESVSQASVAADPAGNPHVAYRSTSGAINYITAELEGWGTPQTILAAEGAYVDLDVSPTGTVHFAFEGNINTDDSYNEIGYCSLAGGTLSATDVLFDGFYWYENGARTGRYYSSPSIKADSGDNYHVVVKHHAVDGAMGWTDHSYYLVYKSNAVEIGSESNGNAEMGASNNPIVLTAAGPAIVYNNSSGALKMALPAGTDWNSSELGSVGTGASVDVTGSGNPIFAYTANGNLYFLEEGGMSEQLDSGGVGYPVVLNGGEQAYVFYVKSDGADYEVYCASQTV